MKTKKPLISVLIAAFNHQDYIEQCINSALAQTYKNIEVVVTDDCSSDETAARIKAINDPRVKFTQNKYNHGLNGTLNVAFGNAKGDYVSFIGSDDFFDADYFERFVQFINDDKAKYTVLYPKIVHVDDAGNALDDQSHGTKCHHSAEILKELFLFGNTLGSPGMIIPRFAAKKIFPLDAGIHQHQDFIMHIQLLLLGECAFVPGAKVYYRVPTAENGHMGSDSRKAYKRIELETPHALGYFLRGIKTAGQLQAVFGDMLAPYGKPCDEAIPYFLARLALDAERNRLLPIWGFRTLIEFLSAGANQQLLFEKYGFDYKQFSELSKKVPLLDDFLEMQEQAFTQSFSWKITAPIRGAMGFVRGLKR